MIENNYSMIDEDTKAKIRKHFNVDDFSIKRDIQIVKEWIKQQPHLPQNVQGDDFIERCLLMNKFRVEPTKKKLERYYTMKRIYVDSFRKIQSPLPSKTNLILPLPGLNDKFERIVIFHASSTSPDDDDYIMNFLKYCLCCSEYSLRCDYSLGQRIIQDCNGLTLEQVRKYGIVMLKYGQLLEAYFMRVVGIEFINAPSFADTILRGMKAVLNEKVFGRISVHKDLESLHRNVNKAYLPKEFGGDLKSMDDFIEMWDKEFESNITVLEKIVETEISNEELRVGELKYNEIFGIDGSFKKLAVD